MSTSSSYQGPSCKLVITFDVGTTYSSALYMILDPGLPPVIEGSRKIHTVGSEATEDVFLELAEREGFLKVEWFKLHMCPKHLSPIHIHDSNVPLLPLKKIVIEVFADFLQ
ncbi:hypothetical protein Moror_2706 [Moniliophthora roreri MCA 2997]|uniref:Uncharacterized protein n=1 Tax=Moniliophthora roreri (strain MCA 2997) TaxID=1381753 RepID=V2XFX9_MONRO|nr:hypothetical protein Moror_2706 [Moniliophthora roreri MCA 2997]